MSGNVKIPLELFSHTLDLLERLDGNAWDEWMFEFHAHVLGKFRKKAQSLDLRASYTRMLFAPNEETRTAARLDYLARKRRAADQSF
jgi:hypothetical protein